MHEMGNKMAAPSGHQWLEHLISPGFALTTLWVAGYTTKHSSFEDHLTWWMC